MTSCKTSPFKCLIRHLKSITSVLLNVHSEKQPVTGSSIRQISYGDEKAKRPDGMVRHPRESQQRKPHPPHCWAGGQRRKWCCHSCQAGAGSTEGVAAWWGRDSEQSGHQPCCSCPNRERRAREKYAGFSHPPALQTPANAFYWLNLPGKELARKSGRWGLQDQPCDTEQRSGKAGSWSEANRQMAAQYPLLPTSPVPLSGTIFIHDLSLPSSPTSTHPSSK